MNLALFLLLIAPQASDLIELKVARDAELDLDAFWEPCRESAYGRFEKSEVLRSPEPEKDWEFYGSEAFAALLPDKPVSVGDVWQLDREAALVFLRQFHPGATSKLHHEPSGVGGAFACLRAVSESHAEVLLRAHAEFILDDGTYFCPAQFEGRLLLDRETQQPVAFRLFLPSRNTNVDVNIASEKTRIQNEKAAQQEPQIITLAGGQKVQVVMGKSFGEADIGWVPRMELVGGEAPEVSWAESIDDEAARRLLRDQFYAPIDWLPFELAVQRARQLDKPLHVIALFGAYDDESC